jgi:hypothetical protein
MQWIARLVYVEFDMNELLLIRIVQRVIVGWAYIGNKARLQQILNLGMLSAYSGIKPTNLWFNHQLPAPCRSSADFVAFDLERGICGFLLFRGSCPLRIIEPLWSKHTNIPILMSD